MSEDTATGKLIDGDAAQQAEQTLHNLATALQAAGKTMADFAAVNEVYSRHFTESYPARTTIAVAALPLGASVEMVLIAG